MATKTESETRYIELNIPQEVLVDTAEIIEENELEATILGKDEDDCIIVGLDYSQQQRESVMEILELIEDHNNLDEEEESEDEEEDQENED